MPGFEAVRNENCSARGLVTLVIHIITLLLNCTSAVLGVVARSFAAVSHCFMSPLSHSSVLMQYSRM